MKRIGVLTSGGDCPGLNAVIRAIVKKALGYGYEVIGIEDGFEGLLEGRYRKLTEPDVSGILTTGGTILGTSRLNPYAVIKNGKVRDLSSQLKGRIQKLKLRGLICIGGDGSLSIAYDLSKERVPIVGVPKTIDNDIRGTDISFGFSSAVHMATEGVDRLHTTAESHHRIMILEVMGREAGWIALYAGIGGGGDIILIPEIPYDIKAIIEEIKRRKSKGKRFTILVVAEGIKPKDGPRITKGLRKDEAGRVRLGGASFLLGQQIEQLTGLETRNVVLGYLQRGGTTSPYDRILGTQLGSKAFDLVLNQNYGYMSALQNNFLTKVPLSLVAQGQKLVPPNHPLIETARSLETCFGI